MSSHFHQAGSTISLSAVFPERRFFYGLSTKYETASDGGGGEPDEKIGGLPR